MVGQPSVDFNLSRDSESISTCETLVVRRMRNGSRQLDASDYEAVVFWWFEV